MIQESCKSGKTNCLSDKPAHRYMMEIFPSFIIDLPCIIYLFCVLFIRAYQIDNGNYEQAGRLVCPSAAALCQVQQATYSSSLMWCGCRFISQPYQHINPTPVEKRSKATRVYCKKHKSLLSLFVLTFITLILWFECWLRYTCLHWASGFHSCYLLFRKSWWGQPDPYLFCYWTVEADHACTIKSIYITGVSLFICIIYL